MNPWIRSWCAGAMLACMTPGFAQNLAPGGFFGWGNLPFSDKGAFSQTFEVRWFGSVVPVEDRWVDVSGSVLSYPYAADQRIPGTYVLNGIQVYSLDRQAVVGSVLVPQGSDAIHFTFGHLAEGDYRFDVNWSKVPGALPAEEAFAWQEWSYAFRSVASPAPEASQVFMTLAGLAGVAAWVRRQKRVGRQTSLMNLV
jgi:hypothetical protein